MTTLQKAAQDWVEKESFTKNINEAERAFRAGANFVQEWHPIEKLPKEGKILLMYDNNPDRVASGYIDQYYKPCGHWIGRGWKKATHFRMINVK